MVIEGRLVADSQMGHPAARRHTMQQTTFAGDFIQSGLF